MIVPPTMNLMKDMKKEFFFTILHGTKFKSFVRFLHGQVYHAVCINPRPPERRRMQDAGQRRWSRIIHTPQRGANKANAAGGALIVDLRRAL